MENTLPSAFRVNSTYNKIGLNLKSEQTFVLLMENILGPLALTNIIEIVPHIIMLSQNGVRMAEWSKLHNSKFLVIVVLHGSSPGMII